MFRSPARFVPLFGLLPLVFAGCGDGGAKEKLDHAQNAVTTSLDAWKRGDKPTDLHTGPQAIEFFDDDWNRSRNLVEFEIRKTYLESDGTARCAVELVLQSGQQSPERIQVTYQIVTKEQRLLIARDPFS